MAARIVPFAPAHREAFAALNRAWIERFFVLEDEDRRLLDDPEGAILAPGGAVFCLVEGEGDAAPVVGTAGLLPAGPGVFELVKMAVAPAAQGRGYGRRLLLHALDAAEALGARRVFLLTNSALAPALHLYRTAGFVDEPLDVHEYARGDVQMGLALPRPG